MIETKVESDLTSFSFVANAWRWLRTFGERLFLPPRVYSTTGEPRVFVTWAHGRSAIDYDPSITRFA